MPRLLPCLLALALLAPVPALAQTRTYEIEPAAIDGSLHDFNAPNYVIPNTAVHGAPLVVFLGGAGTKPSGNAEFLKFIASQGYPVIALEYNDDPAVAQVCQASTDPDCAEAVRRARVEGGPGPGTSPLATPGNETIAGRLTTLLVFLTQDKPGENWDLYLDGYNIRWDRIVFAGLDQGAGMAAYIAKHHPVARVALFSSPWDPAGPGNSAAPWLSLPSATPAARWYAAYPQGQTGADLSKSTYAALQIPADHIRITSADGHGGNPANLIRDRRYQADWSALFGKPNSDGTVQ